MTACRVAWLAGTLALAALASGVDCAAAEPKRDQPVPETENPVLEIVGQMRQAEGLIAQAQSGPATQKLQGEIIARLDALLKQAGRGGGQPKPSSAKSPGMAQRKPLSQPPPKPGAKPGQAPKPAKDSRERPGGPEARRAGDVDEVLSVLKQRWGELPERAREQMLQLLPREEFLPKYELLIEEYYRRLSEEKRGEGR